MNGVGRVLLLVGPPGVGKSTVAHALVERESARLNQAIVRVEADEVRAFVAGDPRHLEADALWVPLCAAVVDAARKVAPLVVVEGLFYHPQSLTELAQRWDAQVVILSASLETVLLRNARRSPPQRLPDDEVRLLHAVSYPYDVPRINAETTLEDVVAILLTSLAEHFP